MKILSNSEVKMWLVNWLPWSVLTISGSPCTAIAAWHYAEQDNVFAALNWAESNSPDSYAELAGFVYWIWRLRSDIIVGKDYLEKAITKNIGKSEIYARAVLGLGNLYWLSGDGLGIERRFGNPGLINYCQIYLCTILVHSKQYERGRPLVEEVLLSSEKLDQLYIIEGALHLLGDCTVGMKDFKEGEKRYAKGIEVSYGHGNVLFATTDIQGVAFALSGQRRWAKALRLDAAARVQYKELDVVIDEMLECWDEWIDTYIEGAKREVGEVRAKRYEEEGIAMVFEYGPGSNAHVL